jgi:hypothetical protein
MIKEKADDRLPQERAGEVIDGALLEWFYHGREVYERRRAQMKSVVAECEISHFVRTLDLTFEDRVATWKENYAPAATWGRSLRTAEVKVNTPLSDTRNWKFSHTFDSEALSGGCIP